LCNTRCFFCKQIRKVCEFHLSRSKAAVGDDSLFSAAVETAAQIGKLTSGNVIWFGQ
jgi:hypothetical protein